MAEGVETARASCSHEELDMVSCEVVLVIDEILKLIKQLEQHVRSGFWLMSKSRYTMGCSSVGELQYDQEMRAQVTVDVKPNCEDYITLSRSNSSLEVDDITQVLGKYIHFKSDDAEAVSACVRQSLCRGRERRCAIPTYIMFTRASGDDNDNRDSGGDKDDRDSDGDKDRDSDGDKYNRDSDGDKDDRDSDGDKDRDSDGGKDDRDSDGGKDNRDSDGDKVNRDSDGGKERADTCHPVPPPGLRRRHVGGASGGECVELVALSPAAPSPTRSRDPLQWFGVLVPQTLRQCQREFSSAISLSLDLATHRARLCALVSFYKGRNEP